MLYQVKLLLKVKGGCSEEEIKSQFKNVKELVVDAFLKEAIRRRIIKEENGTFVLQQLEIVT